MLRRNLCGIRGTPSASRIIAVKEAKGGPPFVCPYAVSAGPLVGAFRPAPRDIFPGYSQIGGGQAPSWIVLGSSGSQQLTEERFCSGDCVLTNNFSLLEPGVFGRKYYARGIGVFLEVENTGEVSQLVGCNFDPRCDNLSTP